MAQNEDVALEFVRTGIQRELHRRIEQVYEEERKRLNERLDREKAETIAGVALHLMKQADFERVGSRVIITVRTEKDTE